MPASGTGYIYTVWFAERDINVANATELAENYCSTLWDSEECKCVVGQLERAPDTGRLHLQLYVEYARRRSGSRIELVLGLPKSRYHGEARRGTTVQAAEYCSKEDTRVAGPYRHGTVPQPEPGIYYVPARYYGDFWTFRPLTLNQ